MSFNRRGPPPDRRPDRDRHDRPPRRTGGDWTPRDRGPDRPYQPRGGDRPLYGGGRPRHDRVPDEGGMSIRLDPRRLGVLKRLAAEAGVRPGDLVLAWVEERLDAERTGAAVPASLDAELTRRLDELTARIDALESARNGGSDQPSTGGDMVPVKVEGATADVPKPRKRRNAVSAAAGPRVALHDEMIAVLSERGPLSAAELAGAIVERGRYTPPRSGKPLDAAMVSQRVSNPTYRSRFTRNEGRIGLAG